MNFSDHSQCGAPLHNIYIYIYIYVCVCVCVCPPQGQSHYKESWTTEMKRSQAFIPGTETLALLKFP